MIFQAETQAEFFLLNNPPESDHGDAQLVRQGEGALAVEQVHGGRVKGSGSQVREDLL